VHVLRKSCEAVVPGGILLDLQVIRPYARVEAEGRLVYVVDASPLFEGADAARAAVDLLLAEGQLIEEGVDDHEVLKHYENGADLVANWPRQAKPPTESASFLKTIASECVTRERCRLRRLRRVDRCFNARQQDADNS
jgi:hypothetical protein